MSNKQVNDYYKAVDNLNYFYPTMLELLSKKAEYQREHYNQLVKSGFTKDEALEIIKAHPTPF